MEPTLDALDLPVSRDGGALTIVFDLDGTLVDSAPDLVAATLHTLRGRGHDCEAPELLRAAVSHGAIAMLRAGFGERATSWPDDAFYAMLADFLAHYEENIAVHSRPFPGVLAALDELAEAGHTLAVCTNKQERLALRLLGELGLAGRFAAIAGRDTFDAYKPDPRHFVETVRRAGGDPSRAVMVGDSVVDVMTARNAGVPIIAVAFGYSDPPVATFEPDVLIHHFDELDGAIATIARRPAHLSSESP